MNTNQNSTTTAPVSPAPSTDPTVSWISWTHAFTFIDGMAEIIYTKVNNNTVKGSLAALHVALQAVDQDFISAITEIKAGQSIQITIEPTPISDWGTNNTTPTMLSGIIEAVKPVLSDIIQKLNADTSGKYQEMIVALNALMNSFAQVLAAFNQHPQTVATL